MARRVSVAFLALIAMAACANAAVLQSYNVNPSKVSVSGLSAGAFMAVQFEYAFSSEIMGAAIVAGGPYYCAQGVQTTAITNCMYVPSMINLASLDTSAKQYEASGAIDAISNVNNHKVYLYSGTKDSVVNPGSMKALEKQYQTLAPSADLAVEFAIASQHAFITNDYGSDCATLGTPYINNCNYDQAHHLFEHIYGAMNASVTPVAANLLSFDQTQFISTGQGMDTTGYIYVPTACKAGAECALHLALHGCSQNAAAVQDKFYNHAGYNKWAESNNIIVVYPQAASIALKNPNSCFDWFGYTNSAYATKSGVQMTALYHMLHRVMGNF